MPKVTGTATTLVADGPYRATFRLRHVMDLPAEFDFNAMTRTAQTAPLIIDSLVTKVDDSHVKVGWAADIWDGSPGMEMLTNRDGHLSNDLVLFDAVWGVFVYLVFTTTRRRLTEIRWALVNVVFGPLLLVARLLAPDAADVYVPVLAVARTAVDYVWSWRFYFP